MLTYDITDQLVTIPVRVRDASAATVLFDIDAEAASALLPSEFFEVVETSPGRACLALVLVDYRDNDLGAYHEIGLTFFVRPRSGGEDGTFITRLPVDQPFTCEAGRRIWGFPKTVEQIDAEYAPTSSTWTLRMDGQLVLTLQVPRGGADESPLMPMAAYTMIAGVPHSTIFAQQGLGSQMIPGGEGVHLTLGSHPVAVELAGLGIGEVVLSTWTEQMQATFEAPEPLPN